MKMSKPSAQSWFSSLLAVFIDSMHLHCAPTLSINDAAKCFIINPKKSDFPRQGHLPSLEDDSLSVPNINDKVDRIPIFDASILYSPLSSAGGWIGLAALSSYLSDLVTIYTRSNIDIFSWVYNHHEDFRAKVRTQLKGHSSVRAYYENWIGTNDFDFDVIADSAIGSMAGMVTYSALTPLCEKILLSETPRRSPGTEIEMALRNGYIPCGWNGDFHTGKLMAFYGDNPDIACARYP